MPLSLLMILVLLLGAVAGLRTFMAPASVCWGAHLGWIHLDHSALGWMGSKTALVIFTLAAVGELVGDKLPRAPSRLAPPGLIGRALTGALSGAAIGIATGSAVWLCAVLAVMGALAGAYFGYHFRRMLTVRSGLPDLPVALVEDLAAILGGIFLVSRF